MVYDRSGRKAVPPVSAGSNGSPQRATPHGVRPDLICLSHLRWDFVYQRPQHLMSRAAREYRVFFWEEPRSYDGTPKLEVTRKSSGVRVVVPYLPETLTGDERSAVKRQLLAVLFQRYDIDQYVLWYLTPGAIEFTRHLDPLVTIYDCMDELATFKGASKELRSHEGELFRSADLVFTGGQSLYEAKRGQHPNVHLFPSSIEREHFAEARSWVAEPGDQAVIQRPRLGYFGVLDERLDLALIDGVATARPDWSLVFVGPLAKIDMSDLPHRPNIHYLGQKPYAELPTYLAGWDVALMPFAINDATRFISPTKTPEYLAGGKPVVATPVRDVVRPYGELGLVRIAGSVDEFVAAVDATLDEGRDRVAWLHRVDTFLAQNSWDRTWRSMASLLEAEVVVRQAPSLATARIRQSHSGEILPGELSL